MSDERTSITGIRQQITALLKNSDLTPGCKCIASLMAAAYACQDADMPPEIALAMLRSFYRRDPLT
jgi:hypothetical protein